MKKLTAKQKAFCDEYLIDLNATQAAIRAGYSVKTAQVISAENLAKPIIAERIENLQTERAKRCAIDADMVLAGILKVVEDATEMKETESGTTMKNHTAALRGYELLGKHLALFTDKVAHEGVVEITSIERVIIKP